MSPIRKYSATGLLLLIVKQLLPAQVAFVPGGVYQAGFFPRQVVAADINGDGKPDIITANDNPGTLTILTNDGHGNFKLASSPASPGSRCVAVGDFNNDGRPDLVSGNTGYIVSVFTNKSSGIFSLASTASVAVFPMSLDVADINNDGKKDVVVGNYDNTQLNNSVTVLTNNGNGVFATASTLSLGYGPGYSVAAADLNGDGLVDIAAAGGGYLKIFTNKSGGQFQSVTPPNLSGLPQKVIAVEVNGDSHIDLVTANSSANPLSVVTNDGSGHFTLASLPMVSGTGSLFSPLTAADINNDGRVDLIAGNIWGVVYDNTISVLTNAEGGVFAPAFEFSAISPQCVATADFNADNKIDLVAVDGAFSKIRLFFNAPTLAINPTNNHMVVSWPSSWTNWVLQQNSNLATTNWTTSGGVSNDGTNKSLTVAPQPGNMLFRLAAP